MAVKFCVPAIPAIGCAGLRFLISLPIIGLVCLKLGHSIRWPRGAGKLVALNSAFTVVQIASFNWGTSRSLAGSSSILINIHPLVVAPLAWLLLREPLGPRAIAGLAAATVGVVVLLSGKLAGLASSESALIGDLVVLASGMIFGVQTIVQKFTFRTIPPTSLLFLQSLFAAPVFLLLSVAFEGVGAYHFDRTVWLGLLYQGLAVSGFTFSIWMILLKRYPAGRLATVAFLTPLFGVALGNLTRGEPLTWPLLVGGGFVGAGIYLVASERAAQKPAPGPILPGEDAP